MLSLSPAKLLVVLVVALLVLGPEKLPGVARQLGAAWGELRKLRTRLEREVREVLPDLPPTHELTRAVRSPLSYLDRLADEHERGHSNGPAPTGSVEGGPTDGSASGDGAGTRSPPPGLPVVRPVTAGDPMVAGDPMPSVPDDPSMN
jgi:sec-independent protein translocase protein TatB